MRLKVYYLVIFIALTAWECHATRHLEEHPWSRDDLDEDIKHLLANIKPVSSNDPNVTRYPVILVPGDGGNQVHAKLNKSAAPHYLCQLKTKDYDLLWFNFKDLSPYALDCFVDNMKLVYDPETRRTRDTDGVNVRILGFGDTDTVEYLDSGKYSVTGYFDVITAALVKKFNYVRGVNVRGAPYDWRRSPDEFEDYYANLTRLVEDTYTLNNNTKVILIAHSMGNPVTLYWLNNLVNQAWKDKYIRSFVSLSAPWGGASKTLRLQASGDNIDLIVVRPLTVRPYQRSATSTAFLMPSDKFWDANETIISTPERNYTVKDYEAFFNDINFTTGYEYRKNTEKLVYNLDPPHVEVHALYGVGLKTPESFYYKKQKDFPDTQPAVVFGDGDGTVNLRSLLGYRGWIGKQKQPIFRKEVPGSEHVATLKNPAVVEYILNLFND